MEGTQPSLEAAVVGIDVVDVKVGCLRVGLARHWQDVGWDASPAGEGDDRGATIATEFVGRGDDTAKRCGNRHAVQFGQHRIGGRTMTVACHENRDLFGGNPALGRFATSLACLARLPDRLPLNDSRMKVSSPSTMPDNTSGLSPAKEARNRCLQRNAVVSSTSHRSAALAMLTPSIMASACAGHLSFMRKPASGVFVRALKVR